MYGVLISLVPPMRFCYVVWVDDPFRASDNILEGRIIKFYLIVHLAACVLKIWKVE